MNNYLFYLASYKRNCSLSYGSSFFIENVFRSTEEVMNWVRDFKPGPWNSYWWEPSSFGFINLSSNYEWVDDDLKLLLENDNILSTKHFFNKKDGESIHGSCIILGWKRDQKLYDYFDENSRVIYQLVIADISKGGINVEKCIAKYRFDVSGCRIKN